MNKAMEPGKENLFRTEVIERQTQRLHGDILLLPRFFHTLIMGLLLLWVVLTIAWLLVGSYARKETVSGWLEPSEGLTRIYAEDNGLVRQVLVQEGQQVIAGQPLIIVNGDRHLTDGGALESRLPKEYETQRHLLSQQLENGERLYRHHREDLEHEVTSVRQNLSLLEQQLQTLKQRHGLLQILFARNQALLKQRFVAQNDLENARGQELALRNEKQGLLRENLPAATEFKARLLLPVRAAGFVETGQSLDIRYDAFPYQKFGLYKGKVQNISESVLMPNELSNSPLRTEEPVYRISANLQQPFVHAYGRNFPLKPGMTLNADIRLGERSLLQWLLDPIYSLKGRL